MQNSLTKQNPFETIGEYLQRIENNQQDILNFLHGKHKDELMTIDDLVIMTNLAKQTIYQRVSNKSIPFVKVGRSVRFRRSEILNWIENNG